MQLRSSDSSDSSDSVPQPVSSSSAQGHRQLPTQDEEWINGLTHAVGGCLGCLGSVVLLRAAAGDGWTWLLASCMVYCLALVGVYTASTLSHWVREPVWRHRFRSWDQGLIFILIVATYTPISAAHLSGWWVYFTGFMWLLALLGFVAKVAHSHGVDSVALWLYLALGWLSVLAVPTLWGSVPEVVALMVLGGVVYSLGSALLIYEHHGRYWHAGWHVSVIVASAIHFMVIYWSVVPA